MKLSLFKSLYVQVLSAIAIGILLGHFYPELGAQMKPFGDAFVKLIKMVIAPVIFCTVVTGIAGMESMKAVGRTGAVALLYFEVVSGEYHCVDYRSYHRQRSATRRGHERRSRDAGRARCGSLRRAG